MIKDVFITIKGIQGLDGESDTIELATEGQMGIKDGEYYLSYNEGELLDSGDNVKTRLFIKSDGSAVLQRTGTLRSRMQITVGERNICYYSTPQCELVIGIYGEEVSCSLDEKGGTVVLKYTIDSNLQLISKNEVNISVREV